MADEIDMSERMAPPASESDYKSIYSDPPTKWFYDDVLNHLRVRFLLARATARTCLGRAARRAAACASLLPCITCLRMQPQRMRRRLDCARCHGDVQLDPARLAPSAPPRF